MLFKLGLFTVLIVVAPISTYFFTLGRVFDESDSTAAAIAAAVVANLILAAFVVVAVLDDKKEQDEHTKAKSQ